MRANTAKKVLRKRTNTASRRGLARRIKPAPKRNTRRIYKKRSSYLSDKARQNLVIEFRMKARKLGRSILRKWHARMDLQEVDSIVDLSLCEAVRRFDPTKGASFMTFMYYHLKGNLVRAVSAAANANTVPLHEHEMSEGGISAGALSKSPHGAVNALDVAEALGSQERIAPDEIFFRKELFELSKAACKRLDQLECEVIERIYLNGEQLLDVAHDLGYSRCHISRVKRKALETLHSDLSRLVGIEEAPAKLNTVETEEEEGEELLPFSLTERRVIHRRGSRMPQISRKPLLELRVVNG